MIMKLNRQAKLYLKLGDMTGMRRCQVKIDMILASHISVVPSMIIDIDTTLPVIDRPAYRSVHHESLADEYIGY